MRLVVAFVRFWWSFLVGDEWRIALSVGVITTVGALVTARGSVDGRLIALAVGGTLMITVSAIIFVTGLRRSANPPA